MADWDICIGYTLFIRYVPKKVTTKQTVLTMEKEDKFVWILNNRILNSFFTKLFNFKLVLQIRGTKLSNGLLAKTVRYLTVFLLVFLNTDKEILY